VINSRREWIFFIRTGGFAFEMKEGRMQASGLKKLCWNKLKERLPRKVWTFVNEGKKDRLQSIRLVF